MLSMRHLLGGLPDFTGYKAFSKKGNDEEDKP